LPALPAQAQSANQRCFAETGYCVSGRILEYWQQNGGLPVFGFPIGPQQQERIEGKDLQVQWFERNRLELHPENARPYDVLLGRLGGESVAQGGPATETPRDGCVFFAETGFNICGEILTAWRANGLELDGRRGKTTQESLGLFGYPLTGMIETTTSDGKTVMAQWFERARFELHPENAVPYNVLLGRLGFEVRQPALPGEHAAIITAARTRIGDPGFPYVVEGVCIDGVWATAAATSNDPRAGEPFFFVLNKQVGTWNVIFEGPAFTLVFASERQALGIPETFACLGPAEAP
jgi:hypothetical protein